MTIEQRLADLESLLMHQQRFLDELNAVLIEQAGRIDALQAELRRRNLHPHAGDLPHEADFAE